MFDRITKKLSRTKSKIIGIPAAIDRAPNRTLSLTPSDEQIISKLSFPPNTQVERPPRYQSPSVATGWSERTVFNNIESGFLALPTEILMFLQSYLNPSSEVALRHSCSRFFNLYSTPSFYLSGQDRFDFCCMTERDQDPSKLDRLVCGTCRDLHPRSAFAASEIMQPPTERDCRQVWLCAHRSLGYQKTIRSIKAGVEAPFRAETIDPCSRCKETIRNRSVADRPEKGTLEINIEDPNSESLLISKIAILQAISPSHNTRGMASSMYVETFQAKDVSEALQAINFKLCPHLSLGDPTILSKFCRACINTQKLPPGTRGPPCISEVKREFDDFKKGRKCQGSCYIRGCKTKFMFQARESLAADVSGKRQVWLIIVAYRWLGPLLNNGKDSTWLEHSVNNKDRTEMRSAWEKWKKGSGARPCMPNWSICLLNPEDCNLR